MQDVRRLIADEIHRGFLQLGHNSTLVDLASPYLVDDLNKALTKDVNFVAKYMTDPIYAIQADGIPFTNKYKIPTITFSVDVPYLYVDRFENQLYKHSVTIMNRSYTKNFFKTCLPEYKTSCVSFMPHAGISAGIEFTEEQYYKRSNRLFFVGTFTGLPEQRPWEVEPMPNLVRDLMEDAYSCVDESTDIDEAILYVFQQRNLQLNDQEFSGKLFRFMFDRIYWYDHSVHRMKILQHLIDNGYEIDFYGMEWPESIKKYKNVFFKGSLNIVDTIKMFNNYKLTINPFHQSQGAHDRTFNALANGCQCLLYSGAYYQEIFAGYQGLHYLPHKDLSADAIDKQIQTALNEVDFANMEKTRNYVLNNHMWANRAKQITEIHELNAFQLQWG